jgi:putative ABC transport system permease protein
MKNRAFSIINILGLSVGISVCFIIMMYVFDELSYDKFNVNADRIVRIAFKANINGGKIKEANVMPPTAQALKNDYPEVEQVTRLRNYGQPKINYNNKKFDAARLAYVDSNFFSVFSFQFLKGNASHALDLPNSIVITKQMAATIFGDQDPMGKTIQFINQNNALYKITGIIEDMPANSHFHFDLLGSMSTLAEARSTSWMESNFYTYLLLQKNFNYKKLEAKLPGMVEKYMGPQILQAMHLSLTQFRTKGNELGFALQPLTDIHLHSENNMELEAGGDIKYVYIFGAIAIFMLTIACINFINLSTAGASKRAREVGVRKVLGSGKWDLIKQFLIESIILALIAILVAIFFIQIATPVFNELSGKHLPSVFSVKALITLALMGVTVGGLAGIYPAFFLSAFQPIAVLKSKMGSESKSLRLRSALVVFQFFISVCLLVGTIVVYQQMKFIQNKKLGYDKEQLLVLENSYLLGAQENAFKNELLKDPQIANITVSGYRPAGPTYSNNSMVYPDGDENKLIRTLRYDVDEQYIPTLGMQLAGGRNFSKDMATDSTAVIINESAARAFGWGNNAIGHPLTWMNDNNGGKLSLHVIGIVQDFNFKSLHESITPLIMVFNPESGLIIKTKPGNVSALLTSIKKQWADFKIEEPLNYAFMNELYNSTYLTEQKSGRILNIFALLTIFVACLGLFGLATFIAEQRTREIGIRKVLGASVTQVTGMLSIDFLKLVIIASIIAIPVAWWTMSHWLNDFAYRIGLSPWVFVLATLSVIFIALVTVSFQAIRAAIANPVKSLRTE